MKARVNGINLHYEEVGQGTPLIFVHEFAGEAESWRPQVNFFSRRYRTIAYNARGYPPSDVPEDPAAYSQMQAVDDIRGLMDALGIARAHVCGLILRIHLPALRHVRRRVAARVVGDAAIAPAEEADLRLPAVQIIGELVHEHDRRAFSGFFVVQAYAV